MGNLIRREIAVTVCLMISGMCATAVGQDAGDTSNNVPSNLQEIVVTANKRSESIFKVPISMEAYNQESLQQSGVKSVSDLATLTPGVEFDTAGSYSGGTLINIAIRGINSVIGASPVGMYIDDTPIQSRVTSVSYFGNPLPLMFDVDRVEVERGPQGTLFGAGAEGGAIRFINSDPSLASYSGAARSEVSYTKSGQKSYEAGLAVGGPMIANTLGFRASAWYRDDGGYVDRIDPFTGAMLAPDENRTHSYALRLAFTFKPSDEMSITPSIYGQQVRSNSQPLFYGEFSDPGRDRLRNGNLLAVPSLDRFLLPSLKFSADVGPLTLVSVSSYFARDAQVIQDQTSDDGVILGPVLSYGDIRGPEYPTSYADAAPAPASMQIRQISQELRASSNNGAAKFRWTAGLWFARTTQVETLTTLSPFYAVNVFGLPTTACIFCETISSFDKQYAAYGQLDYRLIDKLTLTAGVRVAKTESRFRQAQSGPAADPVYGTAEGVQKETPVTPKIGLEYQLDTSNMVYVSASKGYRVGGANPALPLQTPALPFGCPLPGEPPPYKSDSVWNYEIGAKNKLFNNKLSIATSVYHIVWSNIQQNVYLASCGLGYIANTGDANINGFDTNLQAAVTDSLTLGVAAAYTKTKITKDFSVNGFPVVRSGDVIGSPPVVTSPWDLTVSARYDFRIGGDRDAYIRADDVFHSRNPGPFSSHIADSQVYAPLISANPSTNQLNLRAGLQLESLDLSLFVANALNSLPKLGQTQPSAESMLFTYSTFRPRTVGISANYRFGAKL